MNISALLTRLYITDIFSPNVNRSLTVFWMTFTENSGS
nr:MAG TPA: hypothetical protein [Caudoviricetes sp.]